MVARNFLEVNANIFYPRIDDNNGLTGIVGMEFPSLNYLHYLVSAAFGYEHWYGRLLNLIASSIGIFYFSKIIRRYFDERTALFSTLFLLSSIWFAFSRKMMPDTYCISLMMIGIYYGSNYLDSKGLSNLFLYTLFSSIAILSKIPAGIYFALIVPLWFSDYKRNKKLIISLSSIIPLLLTYLWYFKWNTHLSSEYGIWYNAGKSLQEGAADILSNIGPTLNNFYFNSFHSFVVFGIFLAGLVILPRNRNKLFIYTSVSLSAIFALYVIKSGYFFHHHNYYIIPFVPFMALIAGYFLASIQKQWLVYVLLAGGMIEGIANQQHDFFIKDSELYKIELEDIVDKVSDRDDLIAINGHSSPQQLYLAHRKGWTCSNEDLQNEQFINSIIEKGCKLIVINKKEGMINLKSKTVFDDGNYVVFEL